MSEFTSGSLVLNNDIYKNTLLINPRVQNIYQLNDNWIVFLTNDTYLDNDFPKSIIEISKEIPILYFYNFEDHCWGFRIVINGEEATSFELDYELRNRMVIDLAQKRYPDKDIIEFLYIDEEGSTLRKEIEEEIDSNFWDSLRSKYAGLDIEKFKMFNFSEEIIQKLCRLMKIEYLQTLSLQHNLVDEFKNIIGIQEMSWVRADRAEKLNERFNSLN